MILGRTIVDTHHIPREILEAKPRTTSVTPSHLSQVLAVMHG